MGAPGRAHRLRGASPLRTRQGESLAERQGCPSRVGIRRKPKAKRWPDEQKPHKRHHIRMRRPISSKSHTCTEWYVVNGAGIRAKVCAQYPGRSAVLHGNRRATGSERGREEAAEVSREHSRAIDPLEGLNRTKRDGAGRLMGYKNAESTDVMPSAIAGGTRRNREESEVVC